MNKKPNPFIRFVIGIILVAVGINIDEIATGFIPAVLAAGLTISGLWLLLISIYAIIRDFIKSSKGGVRRTSENNAGVILRMYNKLKADGKNDDSAFSVVCQLVLQDEQLAEAALRFARDHAKNNNTPLSLSWVAFSILIAQMHQSKGAEPSESEKTIAYSAVENVIGWD